VERKITLHEKCVEIGDSGTVWTLEIKIIIDINTKVRGGIAN